MKRGVLGYLLFLGGLSLAALVMTARGSFLASPVAPGERISLRQDSLQPGSRRSHFYGGHVGGK